MRLINTKTLRLSEFFGDAVPEYAILSHTWGDEEVDFRSWSIVQDFDAEEANPSGAQRRRRRLRAAWPLGGGSRDDPVADEVQRIKALSGYAKVVAAAGLALREDGLEWVWVDTCCIDKSSSAELSEAINSMFRWYAGAAVCYAYLVDVPGGLTEEQCGAEGSAFRASRWFTRGWTLQELIAPREVDFYARDWTPLAKKGHVLQTLEEVTHVSYFALSHDSELSEFTIAERMSWAAGRQTTRKEDVAYCLLGLFGVHMPLLYGEGDRAFVRLQEEIIRYDPDISFLSWCYPKEVIQYDVEPGTWQVTSTCSVLAKNPACFDSASGLIPTYIPDWLDDAVRSVDYDDYDHGYEDEPEPEEESDPPLFFMYPHRITNLGLLTSRPLIRTLVDGVYMVALSSLVTGSKSDGTDHWMPVAVCFLGVANRYTRLAFPSPTVTARSKPLREAILAMNLLDQFMDRHKPQEMFIALDVSRGAQLVQSNTQSDDAPGVTGVFVTFPVEDGQAKDLDLSVWPPKTTPGKLPFIELRGKSEQRLSYGLLHFYDEHNAVSYGVLFVAETDASGKPTKWTCRVIERAGRILGHSVEGWVEDELSKAMESCSEDQPWPTTHIMERKCAVVMEDSLWTGKRRGVPSKSYGRHAFHTLMAHIIFYYPVPAAC
ncbi:uncharacterized protein E0L32_005983 [Thyridium curvatum]|uniref:Heterokaryon incompatibility domain-containing protein n=1 Tax=Thyridium curvatum TaxID=1093900 RepID=A0A507AU56_9PEZI|nr:uncharacterized protein E0L32_005983 [Thyridium curvatum]TPX13512.1 hypothetical protein E0L32_005983 [Thyridium curvatum]